MSFQVTEPTQTFIPCWVDPEARDESWLFDQRHRPLKVVRWEDEGVYVEGLVPEPITQLSFQEEGEAACILNRIFDYASSVEALDLRIEVLTVGATIELPATFRERVSNWEIKVLENEAPECWLLDSQGFEWGPLTLDPYEEARQWPFPGKLGEVCIVPRSNRRNCRVEVVKGPFRLDLEWGDAHHFAREVNRVGDFEKVVSLAFPEGVRLSGSPPRA